MGTKAEWPERVLVIQGLNGTRASTLADSDLPPIRAMPKTKDRAPTITVVFERSAFALKADRLLLHHLPKRSVELGD